MIRIILDECLPVKLKYRFQECGLDLHISTVTGQGWSGIKNGKLLEICQKEFDVFVTIDQNLPYQQDLKKYTIAIIALKSKSNRYKDLLDFVEPACEKIHTAKTGKFYEILSIKSK